MPTEQTFEVSSELAATPAWDWTTYERIEAFLREHGQTDGADVRLNHTMGSVTAETVAEVREAAAYEHVEPIRLYADLAMGDQLKASLFVFPAFVGDGHQATVYFSGAEAGPPLAMKATFDRWAVTALGRDLALASGQDDAPAELVPSESTPEAEPGGSVATAEAVAMVPNEAAANDVAPGHGRRTRTLRLMENNRIKVALVLLALIIVFGLVLAGEKPAAAVAAAATFLTAVAAVVIPAQRG